jgi:membrane protease YdiL (CAAX protease family)
MQHRPLISRGRRQSDYSTHVRDPLHILAFLLPLIIAFEIGWHLYLNGNATAAVQTIRAHSVLLAFFQDFGIAGRFLPAITLVTVLIIWHGLTGNRWRLKPLVLLGMVGEALALAMPLVVFIALIALALGQQPPPALQVGSIDPLAALPWRAGVVVSIGAGLYEELLFRLIGVSLLHLILVDVGRLSERTGTILAVGIAAAAFAAYHDVMTASGQIEPVKAVSMLAAGAYFGSVFVLRGFGVAVGVHIMYDVCVLVLSPPAP